MPLITATSDISVELQGHYDRNLLENAQVILLFDKFGQVRPIPKNVGERINFRRYGKLPINTTPLTEGVTPTGQKLAATDIYATVRQYGDFITLTDWLMLTGLDPNLLDIGENLLADQMAETVDTLHRNVLVAGTTIRYANGESARASVATAINDDDIDSIIRTMESNKAKKIGKLKTGGRGVNTSPIRPAYIAVTHTDSRRDIEALTGFIGVEEYASQDALSMQAGEIVEIGAVKNIRFLSTTNAKIWGHGGAAVGATGLKSDDSTNIDVYATLIFGENAYGTIPLQEGTIKNIVKQMGSGGTEDPLNQRATTGWKAATTTKILNEDFIIRLEHGVTDL